MAVPISKISSNHAVPIKTVIPNSHGVSHSFSKLKQPNQIHVTSRGRTENRHLLKGKINYCEYGSWNLPGKAFSYSSSRRSLVLCFSNGTNHTETKDYVRTYRDSVDVNSGSNGNNEDKLAVMPKRVIHRNRALAEACRFAYNDAKFVNERARNDMVLLSRGIMRLDARARQDVAVLGSEFLKLDARAREDTELIDRNMKKKAERLQNIAANLRKVAHSSLKSVVDEHWSDGALEADLRRADFRAKQRAMEDALMALEFVKNIHDMMIRKMYDFPLSREKGYSSIGRVMLEKNGKTMDFFPGEVSTDRITAIQEIYWSMASALSDVDGIDYTDPEELELLITTLIDLDAMDGKSSVSLLVECSSSPDASTRQALANALAAAPSMWTLGNAGMGALQRLAEDKNPAIALAASNAIHELKKQWEIEEGDSWRFTMNRITMEEEGEGEGEGEEEEDQQLV